MFSKRLHQPDINGTHAAVNQPFSKATHAVFKKWMGAGNLFSPNTSFTIRKIFKNIQGLANSPYITELGVAVHEADAETPIVYFPLSVDEKEIIAHVFNTEALEKISTAAFFPKFEKGDSHGMQVYLHPDINEEDAKKLLARHHAIENITRDPKEFATWITTIKKDFGMVEWKPINKQIPQALQQMNYSYDSGRTYFVTPQGVNKATTFLELIKLRFSDIPWENISIAGDSKPTDGPMFGIPNIMHIAVADKSLLEDIPGKNIFVETPDEATKVIQSLFE